MKIYRGGFTYGRAPLGPHASCVHEVSRYGVHARRVRSQAHTANGSASYFHRRHQVSMILRLATVNENLSRRIHLWASTPGTARILRARGLPILGARETRALPGAHCQWISRVFS